MYFDAVLTIIYHAYGIPVFRQLLLLKAFVEVRIVDELLIVVFTILAED
jgi:hypothetical protein